MNCYFDGDTREVILIMDNCRLTLPDYMKISDIEAFVTDKQYQSAIRAIQMHTYPKGQESPMERAMDHYKQRGWFRDNHLSANYNR